MCVFYIKGIFKGCSVKSQGQMQIYDRFFYLCDKKAKLSYLYFLPRRPKKTFLQETHLFKKFKNFNFKSRETQRKYYLEQLFPPYPAIQPRNTENRV